MSTGKRCACPCAHPRDCVLRRYEMGRLTMGDCAPDEEPDDCSCCCHDDPTYGEDGTADDMSPADFGID